MPPRQIILETSDGIPSQERVNLGFIISLTEGFFNVPIYRWESLKASAESILSSRVEARKLASLVGTVISMKLDWGHIMLRLRTNTVRTQHRTSYSSSNVRTTPITSIEILEGLPSLW